MQPTILDPNYKTPRSLQLNVGVQREIRHGMVFSADYLRNVETRTLAGIDVNRVGDASVFNLAGANAAVAATNASFGGCTTVDCAIAAGATMADYANNGLGSATDIGAGCTSVQRNRASLRFWRNESKPVADVLPQTHRTLGL